MTAAIITAALFIAVISITLITSYRFSLKNMLQLRAVMRLRDFIALYPDILNRLIIVYIISAVVSAKQRQHVILL